MTTVPGEVSTAPPLVDAVTGNATSRPDLAHE
jgi:hypothetical protein